MKFLIYIELSILVTLLSAKLPLAIPTEDGAPDSVAGNLATEECMLERKELLSSYIDSVYEESERKAKRKSKSFSRQWQALSKKKNVCSDDISPDSIIDHIKMCEKNSLTSKGCMEEAESLAGLSIEEEREGVVCSKELKGCEDGSMVERDPKNKCVFKPCPAADVSEKDVSDEGEAKEKETEVGKDVSDENNAQEGTQNSKVCPADVKACTDGSWVSRDHLNNCAFKPCPPPKESAGGGDVTQEPKKGPKCSCSNSINLPTANDELTESSCTDISNASIVVKTKATDFPIPTGASAWIDEKSNQGFCMEGDAILTIPVDEAKVCVAEIADRCEQLGRPIPNRTGPQN